MKATLVELHRIKCCIEHGVQHWEQQAKWNRNNELTRITGKMIAMDSNLHINSSPQGERKNNETQIFKNTMQESFPKKESLPEFFLKLNPKRERAQYIPGGKKWVQMTNFIME